MVGMANVRRWIWYPVGATVRLIVRNGRRIGVSILGFVLVVAGLALLVLPGPGILLLIGGLAVLASEYVWAQRALNLARRAANRAKERALGRGGKPTAPGRS
jgi:uncharacterized protein (TIGR02611 family)